MDMKLNVLLVLLWSTSLPAEEPAGQTVGSLANVRWQSLPRSVETVFVGPDGRTWYQCNSGAARAHRTVAAAKRQIEKEFHKAAPQVEDVHLVLLEPGGRVWFSFRSNGHMMLLGYDGKSWTDYTILEPGDMISGHCATRGALLEGRANRFAGGAGWFITFRGVLRFDGQRWQYQKFSDQPDRTLGFGNAYPDDAVWLAVSPDGQAAVAYAGTPETFWAFQRGKWERFDFVINGRQQKNTQSRLRHGRLHGLVMPDARTAWTISATQVLQRISLATTGKPGPSINDLIVDLKDDRAVVREEATWQLHAMGPSIQIALKKALDESTDLEPQSRLKSIVNQISISEPQAIESVFRSVRVSGCRQLYEDGTGRVFLTASKIDGQDSGAAILERDGKATVLRGEPLSNAWAMSNGDDRPPILAPSGDQIWLANRGTTEPPRLLDLKKGAFVGSLPYPDYNRLHAVSAEGRVFVSVAIAQGLRSIEVYTPGAADTESPLEVSHIPVLSHRWAITDAGSIWAHGLEGLTRFDGRQWTDIRPSQKERPEYLLPGRHDTMLLWGEHSATLYEGPREVGSGERFTLLEQHRARIEQAFGPGSSGGQCLGASAGHCGVQVDLAGHIWCWEPSGRLLVELDGVWSDADEALTEAGSGACHVVNAVLVGDGSRLYVRTNHAGRIGGSAFFAEVKNGKPHFAAAPRDVSWFEPPRNLFDRDGGFWIGVSTVTGQVAYRVGPEGKVEEIPNLGLPALADEAGDVWQCEIRGPVQDNFHIWRKGQPVQKLVIPKADLHTFLFSDQPGSVYASTVSGLQHLVADAPNFNSYRMQKLHLVEGVSGQALSYGYSRHGYLAVLTALDTRKAPYYRLNMVRLPKSVLPSAQFIGR
jgi:hypothetical protein